MADIRTTVAFTHASEEAAREFWQEIRTRFDFAGDDKDKPTRAFAVAAYDLFALEEAIDSVLNSSLTADEKVEAISELDGVADLDEILRRWEITS
jgi:hypothetical protein